jgi:hypothetical protein
VNKTSNNKSNNQSFQKKGGAMRKIWRRLRLFFVLKFLGPIDFTAVPKGTGRPVGPVLCKIYPVFKNWNYVCAVRLTEEVILKKLDANAFMIVKIQKLKLDKNMKAVFFQPMKI